MTKLHLTLNQVSQIAHVLAGMLGVLGPMALFGPHAFWYGVVGMTGLAAVKEFYIDPRIEDPATQGSDLLDFVFYLVGISAGIALRFTIGKHV